MLKEINEYSKNERMNLILCGTDFATYSANKDIEKYDMFLYGEKEKLSEEDLRSVSILSVLERLGYPMGELGTYLYKELILEVCDNLKGMAATRRNMNKFRELLAQLSDGFSNLYHSVARENLEIGIKPFHLYVEQAIQKIDKDDIDADLVREIFGEEVAELTYGLQAFQIAAYCSGLYKKKVDASINVEAPVVKKLTNTPNDIALKISA